MSESSTSHDEEDIAEEENQNAEVIYDQIIRTSHYAKLKTTKEIEKPMWKDLRQQC